MQEGSIVRLNDDNEWKDKYGIVKYMKDNVAWIFCVDYPTDLYVATQDNNICEIRE